MIEAVIAGMIIVSFLIFLSRTSITFAEDDLSPLAYKSLEGLNKQGLLKADASLGDFNAIKNRFSFPAHNHSIEICNLDDCVGEGLSAGDVWVGSYIIPGNAAYGPKEVRLYLSM